MPMNFDQYLADLESRIDDRTERALEKQWEDFADGKAGGVFVPRRPRANPSGIEWPSMTIHEAIGSPERMALSQYRIASDQLARGGGELLAIRANYGSGIMACALGAEPYFMPEDILELPISRALPGGTADIRRMIARGIPAFDTGYAAQVFRVAEIFRDVAGRYPMIAAHVHIYEPDIQGPLDAAELLWGGGMYTAFYDEPELVKDALAFVTDAIVAFRKKWDALCPPYSEKYNVEWGWLHRGGCMIREDSMMNLSGEFYREFVMPQDQRLLTALGGGAIHFCGRGDHYIEHAARLTGLSAVNLSQPAYNDMRRIYAHTIEKNIQLLALAPEEAAAAMRAGRDLSGKVFCVERPSV